MCIIGGGIAGIQCALDLSEAGVRVVILEKGDAVGGVAAELDKTFPTNDCSMCTLAPKLIELSRRPQVEILTRVEIGSIVEREEGLSISITLNPRYVDEKRCVSCGRCEEVCPIFVTDPSRVLNSGKKAVSKPYPQAIPNSFVIDPASCLFFQYGTCRRCEEVCPRGAIDLDQTRVGTTIGAKAVVVATGARPFDPTPISSLGYGSIPNVITNLEMEQMMRATGPTNGRVVRPSDGESPARIAWVQCAGSRTMVPLKRPFCSSTCCMSSVKEAFNVKEKCHNIVTDIFYLDLRAHQKGSERYYQLAKEAGVNFIRCRVSNLEQAPGDRIAIRYRDERGRVDVATYDLVVLSVGRDPKGPFKTVFPESKGLMDEFGFIIPSGEENFRTRLPRIYACGAASAPKSIPHSIVEGSAAAGAILKEVSLIYDTAPQKRPICQEEYPHPKRIGVFVCRCGGNISERLDTRGLAAHVSGLKGVGYCQELDFACSEEGIKAIKEAVKDMGLNGVVVAACSPHTHEAIFGEALCPMGIERWSLSMANIRNQNAWVHEAKDPLAFKKAVDQVALEVRKLTSLRPSPLHEYPVTRRALVIGGGMSGMRCALELAALDVPVTLVERSSRLGGHAINIETTWRGTPLNEVAKAMAKEVESHPKIELILNGEVVSHTGKAGSFTSKIVIDGERSVVVTHGVTIVAIGAEEYVPKEYLYSKSSRVLTHLEFDSLLAKDRELEELVGHSGVVAFIQCVGSREPERPYCSRVCCTHTIKRALLLKERNPGLDIYVFYRQLRTFGLKESLLLDARQKGIKFVHFDREKKPIVQEVVTMEGEAPGVETSLKVTYWDSLSKREDSIYPGLLVLATAIVPDEENVRTISRVLGIPLDEDLFLKEAHLKLRPVETIQKGVFLVGLAQYPKEIDETISQCLAVVSRAYASILSQKRLILENPVAKIVLQKCDGCGVCVDPCPYRAIKTVEYVFKGEVKKIVEIEEANCTGCGICVATCPKEAVEIAGFEPDTIMNQIEALLEDGQKVRS